MGNYAAIFNCPVSEMPQLSSLLLDICPVPSYEPNLLINDILVSPNSSLHLSDRYRDAQNSLSPSELALFTRRLRTTFGREGKVTAGGVGVVALALAVLFDTLAKEVKGQWVPESGPVPGLFLQESGLRTHLDPVLLVSDYLRLIPGIANNPARMREETEKCLLALQRARETYVQRQREGLSEVDVFNSMTVFQTSFGLQQLHRHLSNSTESVDLWYLTRGEGQELSFNCDVKAGNTAFKQDVLKSNDIMEELKRCHDFIPLYNNRKIPFSKPTTESDIPDIGKVFTSLSFYNLQDVKAWSEGKLAVAWEDFDLKAKSHLPF